jgi:hypothetical protein
LLIAVAVSLPSAATGSSQATVLTASVGPGFTISLRNPDGTSVTNLAPGEYTINVDDKGTEHNFALRGPGVDMRTGIEAVETATWTVTVTDGTYTYLCEAHPTNMKRTFTVGTRPPAAPKLSGRVTAKAISLRNAAGARIKAIPANTYKITVSDRTKKQNFHLIGPGVNRKTKVAAVTTKTWTVNLTPGKYVYRSDKKRTLRGRFTVTSVPPA